MNISVFGLGYVGAVSCGCLTDLGHNVIGVDINEAKVDLINQGLSPIVEDGLSEILGKAVQNGTLRATTDVLEAVQNTELAFICVGTPSSPSGGVNSIYLERVINQIGQAIRQHSPKFFAVLNRSTSLPGVHKELESIFSEASGKAIGNGIGYCCHPEFLREGVAVSDFYHPPKIVFGTTDRLTEELCGRLYPSIKADTFFVSPGVAALVKYADNCFHAVKVTFGNEIGMICETQGVDSREVMDIFCADRKLNISQRYLKPGFAFGGSCLPKDLRGILDSARESANPLPMLAGALESNRIQINKLVKRVVENNRPNVGIIGLAFKEGTDDVRESPMLQAVEQFVGKGLPIKIYDEHLALQSMIGANKSFALQSIPHLAEVLFSDVQVVINHADVLIVSHQLSPDVWSTLDLKPDLHIIDVINVKALHQHPGYDGLYW